MTQVYKTEDPNPLRIKFENNGESAKITQPFNNIESSLDQDVNIVPTKIKNELTVFQKVCFGIAGLPYQLYFCCISVFTTIFLLNTAGLPPSKTTYILFISRIMDAVTDPIYGFLVNKTKITRFGKMKPWITLSIPLTIVCYIMMWFVPPGFSETQLFIWFIFWHSALYTFITGIRIPHTSMTMYLCSSKEERQLATIIRMAFEMVGILMGIAIPGPFVSGDSSCIKLNNKNTTFQFTTDSYDLNTISNQIITQATNSPEEKTLTNWDKYKYTYIAMLMTVIFLICTLLLVFFVSEKRELLEASEKSEQTKKVSTILELKRMFTFKPYIILALSTILNSMAIQIIQTNLQLYFEYGYTAISSYFIITILALLGCGILFVPLWQFIMKKIEKKYATILGNLSLLPMLIGGLFFRTDATIEVVLFFVVSVLGANSFTSVFLIPWAMLPEALDAYFIKYRTRPDALFYTFFILGTKVLMAIYLGVSQIVLDLVGFQNNVCSEYQNKNVSLAIIYLLSPPPLACLLISSILIYFYPITSKMAVENSESIKKLTQTNVSTINSEFDNLTTPM